VLLISAEPLSKHRTVCFVLHSGDGGRMQAARCADPPQRSCGKVSTPVCLIASSMHDLTCACGTASNLRVIVKGGKAAGVQLVDGRVIEAKAVVSGVNPKLLYQRLIGVFAERSCTVF
jgi:hypothetical protein